MSFLRLAALAALTLAPLGSAAAATHHHRHHVDRSGRSQSGVASYYRPTASGRRAADGRRPLAGRLTAASKTLPLGTRAKVVNKDTGKSVNVTVTDRGPYAKHRILDVSPKAAQHLGMKDDGVAPVKVEPLHEPARAQAMGSDRKR
jgi:rare lipoprotein A